MRQSEELKSGSEIPSETITNKNYDENQIQDSVKMQQSLGISNPSAWLNKILQILSKSSESRTQKETESLFEYAKQNVAFGEIMQKISKNLVKSMINNKMREVSHMKKGTVIAKEGERITHFYFLIDGSLGYTQPIKEIPEFEETFEKLGLSANQQMKQLNKLKKRNESMKLSEPPLLKKYPELSQKQIQQLDLGEKEKFSCGLEDRALGVKYISTVIAKEECWVLSIPEREFLVSLYGIMDEKVKKFMDRIKDIPCLKGQESQKIETFILSLAERKRMRGSSIYSQNDPSQSIYFLTKGEVKLVKNSNLFIENPNNLYVNRLKLFDIDTGNPSANKPKYEIKENEIKKKESILHYADLSSMYNYQPMKKNIEICRMQAFCLLGDEELIQGKKRQTTAICTSLSATYFQISLKRIKQIFGPKSMPAFLQGLSLGAKDRVLKRQEQYANSIHLQNQANMKYFYYDGEKQAQSGSGNKFRITKMNKFLEGNKKQSMLNKSLEGSSRMAEQKKNQVDPFYTAFNFNLLKPGTTALSSSRGRYMDKNGSKKTIDNEESLKNIFSGRNSHISRKQKIQSMEDDLMGRKYQTINPQQKKKLSQIRNQVVQYPSDEEDDEEDPHYLNTEKPAHEEMKIMNITHTWKLIKKKVDTQFIKSQKISPKKFSINVREPLIENEFLMDLEKEKKRLDRKIRKDKITLVSRNKESLNIQTKSKFKVK